MRISDWSSDVCSSDLRTFSAGACGQGVVPIVAAGALSGRSAIPPAIAFSACAFSACGDGRPFPDEAFRFMADFEGRSLQCRRRSEEHTSELQSLMRISYAVFCLKKTT